MAKLCSHFLISNMLKWRSKEMVMNHLMSNYKTESHLTSANSILIFLLNLAVILAMPLALKNWLNRPANTAILFDVTFPIMRKCYFHHQQQNTTYWARRAIGKNVRKKCKLKKSRVKMKMGGCVPTVRLSTLLFHVVTSKLGTKQSKSSDVQLYHWAP